MICKALTGAFGTVGAWIIILVLLIICAVIITERSFIGGVKTGSRKVYDTAREDARRHRIQAEERRAARQKAMEEDVYKRQPERVLTCFSKSSSSKPRPFSTPTTSLLQA